MAQNTLLLVEATGIQSYIFGSNQLAQHIGASELVRQATTDWVCQWLPEPNNFDGFDDRQDPVITDQSVWADNLAAEAVYVGGGNAVIIFQDDRQALAFARRLTRQVLERAPGLQLVIKRERFDPAQDVLSECHQELREKLAQRKLGRPLSIPLLGLGVTATGVYTGDPAVDVEDDRLISAQVKAKLDFQAPGNERLAVQLAQVQKQGYEFVYDFGDLGTPGESSYLAVIHADGNRMGERIKALGRKYDTPDKNPGYVLALRRFSESVQKAAQEALDATVDMLLDPRNLKEGKLGGQVPVYRRRGARRLPFRPIVFGGDDVTFVCEGRLGLTVAAKYLAEYYQRKLSDGELAYGRAGVAIVKSHYPFSRAYALAEDLCASAKDYILQADAPERTTALSWHFAVTGLVLPLEQIWKREYRVEAGNLRMRPLRLNDPDADWRSWKTFQHIMAEFQKKEVDGGQWAGRRNKIKALRDALRAGPQAVRLFMQGEKDLLPEIPRRPGMRMEGWQGGICGYYDAIEALDFYVPLKGGVSE
jgi:hypothetical protein